MKACVAHFYGWTDEYINRMPYSVFIDYFKSINAIRSNELSLDLRVNSYPYYKKKSDRDKLLRDLKLMYERVVGETHKALPNFEDVIAQLRKIKRG